MSSVILSSPILIEDGTFTRKTITQIEAQKWVNENEPTNFSAHQTSKILDVKPASTREDAPGYDEALVISPNERLEFGREYTKAEIEAIGVSFVLIIKEKNVKPSSFDQNFYGCPKPGCDWPLTDLEEYEYTGGVTCACGAFVPLPNPPQPPRKVEPYGPEWPPE